MSQDNSNNEKKGGYLNRNLNAPYNYNYNMSNMNNAQYKPMVNLPYTMNAANTPSSINNYNNIHNISNININPPYTNPTLSGQVNSNNINKQTMPNMHNLNNPYMNYYNPLIIQNYYAMLNANKNQIQQSQQFQQSQHKTHYQMNAPYQMNTPYQMHNKNFNNKGAFPFAMNSAQNQNRGINYQSSHYSANNSESSANTKPVSAEESMEIQKWIEARKRNFPTEVKKAEKEESDKQRINVGMISNLERKLREKIKVMKCLDKKGYMKKERRNNNNGNRRNRRNKNRSQNYNKNRKVDDQPEEGEIVEVKESAEVNMEVKENTNFKDTHVSNRSNTENTFNKKEKHRIGFRYKKSQIYENLIKSDKIKEMNVILQAFRYFVNEQLI